MCGHDDAVSMDWTAFVALSVSVTGLVLNIDILLRSLLGSLNHFHYPLSTQVVSAAHLPMKIKLHRRLRAWRKIVVGRK